MDFFGFDDAAGGAFDMGAADLFTETYGRLILCNITECIASLSAAVSRKF